MPVPDSVPPPGLAPLAALYQAMPPVAALQVRVAGFDGATLRLQAPLAANINDKGCAFGGSLVSLMTLAGWGLVWLRLRDAGIAADVFVADSQVRYRAPLFADLAAQARARRHRGRRAGRPGRWRRRRHVRRALCRGRHGVRSGLTAPSGRGCWS